APGGLHADLDTTTLAGLPATLGAIAAELAAAVRAVIRSEGVLDRLHGTGYVSSDMAAAPGALGAAARAAGIASDLRRQRPYAAYDELELAPVAAAGGDVAARFHVRAHEATDSLRIIGECLRRLPEGSVVRPLQSVPKAGAVAIAGAEGPRGTSWL